jgi:hypothetical protein
MEQLPCEPVWWLLKNLKSSWELVAHACNPSYSGGRDQEDCGLKPPGANSLRDPISKKLLSIKGLVEWLKVWLKPQYH